MDQETINTLTEEYIKPRDRGNISDFTDSELTIYWTDEIDCAFTRWGKIIDIRRQEIEQGQFKNFYDWLTKKNILVFDKKTNSYLTQREYQKTDAGKIAHASEKVKSELMAISKRM